MTLVTFETNKTSTLKHKKLKKQNTKIFISFILLILLIFICVLNINTDSRCEFNHFSNCLYKPRGISLQKIGNRAMVFLER